MDHAGGRGNHHGSHLPLCVASPAIRCQGHFEVVLEVAKCGAASVRMQSAARTVQYVELLLLVRGRSLRVVDYLLQHQCQRSNYFGRWLAARGVKKRNYRRTVSLSPHSLPYASVPFPMHFERLLAAMCESGKFHSGFFSSSHKSGKEVPHSLHTQNTIEWFISSRKT